MKARELLNIRKNDPSKIDGSYQESLVSVTKAGSFITVFFFMLFAFIYSSGPYPMLAVWVNLIAVVCSLLAYFVITKLKKHRAAAHLVTIAIYISSVGVMLISGGIHSSSVVWQIFVPVAAFIMAGIWAGLRWGFICLITVFTFYVLEINGIASFPGFETTQTDRLIDLAGAIIATSIAIWYSDSLKSRSLRELEEAQEKLNYYATIDPLTNTYNRRYFIDQSEKRIKRIYTSQGYASFLLFDIDHFKQINDTHGHIIGDQILRGVANACSQYLRPDDILGRFGGEEFVVLLPDTNVGHARRIAERLRSLIEKTPIQTDIGAIRVTISVGVAATAKPEPVSLEQLIFRADQAMYMAKQAGRNKVVFWEEKEN
ncbi:MAG: hypothetical protein Kow002_19010 [Anaerolineales bacterium]